VIFTQIFKFGDGDYIFSINFGIVLSVPLMWIIDMYVGMYGTGKGVPRQAEVAQGVPVG
jgi:hypothetical protein